MDNTPSHILTVSIGLKIVSDFQDMNFDGIDKAVDDALYQAKDHGRDQSFYCLNSKLAIIF